MRPAENATDFRNRFRRIIAWYDRTISPQLDRQRKILYPGGRNAVDYAENGELEAQIRAYLVDAMLAVLGWHVAPYFDVLSHTSEPHVELQPTGQLIIEGQLRGERGNPLHLDYLGVATDIDAPYALVVETKRPGDPGPRGLEGPAMYAPEWATEIAHMLGVRKRPGKWPGWLHKLCEYIRSLHRRSGHWPQRVVLTNGDWLVIFIDTAHTFDRDPTDGKAPPDPKGIRVFLDFRGSFEQNTAELFDLLSYQRVLRVHPCISPTQVPFFVGNNPANVNAAMYGLILTIGTKERTLRAEPVILTFPVLFLHLASGGVLRVRENDEGLERELFYDKPLSHQLAEVEKNANVLLRMVEGWLGRQLPLTSVEEYVVPPDNRGSLLAVREITATTDTARRFELVTGRAIHYSWQCRA